MGKDIDSLVLEIVRKAVSEPLTVKPKDECCQGFMPQPDEAPGTHEFQIRNAEEIREFARRLDEWIALHPVLDHVVDGSRDAIYGERRT